MLGISVFILSAANIVYWWPDDKSSEIFNYGVSQKRPEMVSLDSMHALEFMPLLKTRVKRDLFSPVAPKKVVQDIPILEKPVIPKVEKSVPKIENNIAPTDQLIHYRLAGVAVKRGKRVAYLLDGKIPFVAYVGDNLTRSVSVESIGEQTAIIKDLQTGFTRKLKLVGE
jgi:hypothetical protein